MRNKWMKRGLTAFLIVAVCCCFMPGLAFAAEGAANEADAAAAAAAPAQTPAPAAATAAKGSVAVKTILAPAEAVKDVTTTAAADKKDKSQLDIKTVNGTKEDVKVQAYLWKFDKTLADTKKANDKKVKAEEITAAGLDKKTGEVTINGTKVKLVDSKDGRYLEYTVKAGKTADLKIKLEPVEAAKDKTLEAAVEVKTSVVKPEAAPATPAAPAAVATEGTQTNTNAVAGEDGSSGKTGPGGGTSTDTQTTTGDKPADEMTGKISVIKNWNDDNDKDKIRPSSVTIKLLEDGVDSGKTLILYATDDWKGSFPEQVKQKDGKDIVYTIQEVEVRDYTAAVTGDAATGFIVTNTHTPAATEKVTVSGTVTWSDSDNKYKKRPSNVVIRLYANNTEVQNTKVTADNSWAYSFTDLEKLDSNGNEITYTIKQDTVSGYTTTYKGYNVTNKYKTSSSSSSSTKKSSSGSSSSSKKNSPSSRSARTGDSTHMGLYLALMIIAAGGAAAMVYRRRRG